MPRQKRMDDDQRAEMDRMMDCFRDNRTQCILLGARHAIQPMMRFPMGAKLEVIMWHTRSPDDPPTRPLQVLSSEATESFVISPDIAAGAELVEQSLLGVGRVASNDVETLRLLLNSVEAQADYLRGRLEGYPKPGDDHG